MVNGKHVLYAVHVTDRLRQVAKVQELLTQYGAHVKTRLGLHEVSQKHSAPNGLLVLEMFGDAKRCRQLYTKLNAIRGVEVKRVVFGHP